MATVTTTSTHQSASHQLRFRVLEEARDAVAKLQTLQPLLSAQDEESLAILIDRHLMRQLDKSLREAGEGKIEPLARILK